MKGTILDFSIQTNTGIISEDDQNRYTFIDSEWKDLSNDEPRKLNIITFLPPTTIYSQ